MRRVLSWFLPAGSALVLAGVLAGGFAAALGGRLGTPVDGASAAPQPTPAPKRSGVYRIVALGDSLTRGAGDADKGGYPERVAASLRKGGRTVELVNLAVDGSETKDLLAKLDSPGATSALAGADLVLVSIAGNDLTHAMPTLPGGGQLPSPAALVERTKGNVETALRRIRAASPTAPVRLLGLYNPFTGSEPERRLSRDVLLRFNVALEEASLSTSSALVIPTADLFEERPDRLAADRFHPGPAGYDQIAARVLSSLPPEAGRS